MRGVKAQALFFFFLIFRLVNAWVPLSFRTRGFELRLAGGHPEYGLLLHILSLMLATLGLRSTRYWLHWILKFLHWWAYRQLLEPLGVVLSLYNFSLNWCYGSLFFLLRRLEIWVVWFVVFTFLVDFLVRAQVVLDNWMLKFWFFDVRVGHVLLVWFLFA